MTAKRAASDLRGTLDGARLTLQIDIGFGDAVTPEAELINYPSLLPDVPAPMLHAHHKAAVVAEKLHAVTDMTDRASHRIRRVARVGAIKSRVVRVCEQGAAATDIHRSVRTASIHGARQ